MVARVPRKPRSDRRRNYCGVPNSHIPGIHRRDGVDTKVCARSWRRIGRHSSLSVVVGKFWGDHREAERPHGESPEVDVTSTADRTEPEGNAGELLVAVAKVPL